MIPSRISSVACSVFKLSANWPQGSSTVIAAMSARTASERILQPPGCGTSIRSAGRSSGLDHSTHCAIPMPPCCWSPAWSLSSSPSAWATPTSTRLRASTRTSRNADPTRYALPLIPYSAEYRQNIGKALLNPENRRFFSTLYLSELIYGKLKVWFSMACVLMVFYLTNFV